MTGMYPVVYVALKVKQNRMYPADDWDVSRGLCCTQSLTKTGCIPPIAGMYPVVYLALKVKQNRMYPADDLDVSRGLCCT